MNVFVVVFYISVDIFLYWMKRQLKGAFRLHSHQTRTDCHRWKTSVGVWFEIMTVSHGCFASVYHKMMFRLYTHIHIQTNVHKHKTPELSDGRKKMCTHGKTFSATSGMNSFLCSSHKTVTWWCTSFFHPSWRHFTVAICLFVFCINAVLEDPLSIHIPSFL